MKRLLLVLLVVVLESYGVHSSLAPSPPPPSAVVQTKVYRLENIKVQTREPIQGDYSKCKGTGPLHKTPEGFAVMAPEMVTIGVEVEFKGSPAVGYAKKDVKTTIIEPPGADLKACWGATDANVNGWPKLKCTHDLPIKNMKYFSMIECMSGPIPAHEADQHAVQEAFTALLHTANTVCNTRAHKVVQHLDAGGTSYRVLPMSEYVAAYNEELRKTGAGADFEFEVQNAESTIPVYLCQGGHAQTPTKAIDKKALRIPSSLPPPSTANSAVPPPPPTSGAVPPPPPGRTATPPPPSALFKKMMTSKVASAVSPGVQINFGMPVKALYDSAKFDLLLSGVSRSALLAARLATDAVFKEHATALGPAATDLTVKAAFTLFFWTAAMQGEDTGKKQESHHFKNSYVILPKTSVAHILRGIFNEPARKPLADFVKGVDETTINFMVNALCLAGEEVAKKNQEDSKFVPFDCNRMRREVDASRNVKSYVVDSIKARFAKAFGLRPEVYQTETDGTYALEGKDYTYDETAAHPSSAYPTFLLQSKPPVLALVMEIRNPGPGRGGEFIPSTTPPARQSTDLHIFMDQVISIAKE